MNPFNMLKEDHKKVKAMFQEYEKAGERAYAKKKEIAEKIFHELEVHTKVEEEIFYPAIKENTDKEGQALVAEAFEEHRLVKEMIEEIKKLEVEDEVYQAKFKVLRENVEHHIEEEEGELFPEAKDALEEGTEEVGDEMEERKEELQSQHP